MAHTPRGHNAPPIYVTKSIVPDAAEYTACIMDILSTRSLTNTGSYAKRLEGELARYLDVPFITLTTNGTLALQLALKAACLTKKEVITTPFTYVATVSALLWEGYTPVFADVDEETLCLDPKEVEKTLSDDTAAILPVHIYGNACDTDAFEEISTRENICLIYDVAQAFGCDYKGKSLASYGDFSTVSFHATKVYHTVEGGGVVCKTAEHKKSLELLKSFGHIGDTHYQLGINAKMPEPNAAMGLCLLPRAKENIAARAAVSAAYDALFPANGVRKPKQREGQTYNYAYYPVIFDDEKTLLRVLHALQEINVHARRYFYPSLTTLPYLKNTRPCPIADSIAKRVLALPLFAELELQDVECIMETLRKHL